MDLGNSQTTLISLPFRPIKLASFPKQASRRKGTKRDDMLNYHIKQHFTIRLNRKNWDNYPQVFNTQQCTHKIVQRHELSSLKEPFLYADTSW